MTVCEGRPLSTALKEVGVVATPSVWLAVADPYAVVLPKSKCTFTAAPPGFTEPPTVAVLPVIAVALPVATSVGWNACPKSFCGDPDVVNEKNGVPTAAPGQADPSLVNGFAV